MLPVVIATLLGLVVAKRRNEEPTQPVKPATPKPKPVVESIPAPATPSMKPNTRWTIYDPTDRGEIIIAKKFMNSYVFLPHVEHTASFDPHLAMPGDVKAYRKRYNTALGDRLWQVCAIMTKYGHVYLSVLLSETGEVAPDSQGVLVSYDDDHLDVFIQSTHLQQSERFGRQVYHYDRAIRDEDFLKFLIGDSAHHYSVSNCFM